MRHMPIAEFKDKMSEIIAAAEGGEEITITRHGRVVARLIPPEQDAMDSRRQAFARLASLRAAMNDRGFSVTGQEVAAWIVEGRR